LRIFTGSQIGANLNLRLRQCDIAILVSPFITWEGIKPVIEHLKRRRKPISLRVLTSMDYMAMLFGALDIGALRALLELGELGKHFDIQIRSCEFLHAKIYIFDDKTAVAGSANATAAGLRGGNIELAFVITEPEDVSLLNGFVSDWWDKSAVVDTACLDRHEMIFSEKFAKYAFLRHSRSADEIKPLPHRTTDCYFDTLRDVILAPLRKTRRIKTDKLAASIRESTDSEQCSLEEARERLDFLRFIGLLRRDGDAETLTELGRDILGSTKRAKERLLHVLLGFDTKLNRVLEIFRSAPSEWFTYKALNQRFYGSDRIMDDYALLKDVQWLLNLDALEKRRGGSRLEFRLRNKPARPRSLRRNTKV